MTTGFSDQAIEQLLIGHDRRWTDRRTELLRYRAAKDDAFWQHPNKWTAGDSPLYADGDDDDGLTVKLEVNQIQPWLDARLGVLFYRRVDVTMSAPVWRPVRTGRPSSNMKDWPPLLASYCNEILGDEDTQDFATWNYELAHLYGAPAFKAGWNSDEPGEIPEQLWIDVIEPWNLMLDERSRPKRERYKAHIRYEPEEVLVQQLGVSPAMLKKLNAQHLPDYLADGDHVRTEVAPGERDDSYYRVLEFYDYTAKKGKKRGVVKVFIDSGGDSTSEGGRLIPVSKELFPYVDARGKGVVPIIQVVLKNRTEHPNRALPLVASVYEMNAEDNLLMSILGSAVRRDAGRVIAYLEDKVSEEFLDAIRSGKDQVLAPVSGHDLDVIKALDFGKMPRSLDKYKTAIQQSKQEVSGVSDLAKGRNLRTNTSATEAQLIAGSDDTLGGPAKQRMSKALSKLARLLLIITGNAMKEKGVKFIGMDRGNETVKIPVEAFSVRWRVSVSDAASTPVKEAATRADWVQVEKLLRELVVLAENPEVEDAPAAKAYAEAAVNYIVEVWKLPDAFRWDTLSQTMKKEKEEEPEPEPPAPAPAPAPAPGAQPAGDPGVQLVQATNEALQAQGIDPASITDEQFAQAAQAVKAQMDQMGVGPADIVGGP